MLCKKSLLVFSIALFVSSDGIVFCEETKSKEFKPLIRITDIIKGVLAPTLTVRSAVGEQPANSSVEDDASLRSLPVASDKFKCNDNEGQHNAKNTFVTFDDYQCTNKNKNNGEYVHTVELVDGTKHKEEGVVMNGEYVIRGYFFSKEDPNNFHIYIKDKKGIHYYILPIQAQGTQEYGIGEEEEEICGVRGDSCIDPKVLASLLGG